MKITRKFVRDHFVKSTGNILAVTPVFSALEVYVEGLPEQTSIDARLLGAATTYGLGWIQRYLRDLSREKNKVESKISKFLTHDTIYGVGFGLITSPIFYYSASLISHEKISLEKLAIATAIRAVSGADYGAVTYCEEFFNDLVAGNKTNYVPSNFYNMKRSTRLTIAAILTAASLTLTAGIYSLHNEDHKPKLENIINHNEPPTKK